MTREVNLSDIRATLEQVGKDRMGEIEKIERERLAAYSELNRELTRQVDIAREFGLTWAEISRATGLSRQTLHTVMRRAREEK